MRIVRCTIDKRWQLSFCCCFALFLSCLLTTWPAHAEALPTLTVEQLRDRFENPQTQEQQNVIDLSGLSIDLQDTEFRQAFITGIRSTFTRAHPDRVLDLSHSTIQGDWPTIALSTTVQLVPEILQHQLTPQEWQTVQQHPDILTSLDAQSSDRLVGSPPWHLLRLALRCDHAHFFETVDLSHTLILKPWEAEGAIFQGEFKANHSIWLADLNVATSDFQTIPQFEQALFWGQTYWNQSNFEQGVDFAYSQFEQRPDLSLADFAGVANWRGTLWQDGMSASQTQWSDRALWNDSQIRGTLDLSEAVFAQTAAFRNAHFEAGGGLNLTQATVMAQLDLSNSQFVPTAAVRVDGLVFGSPGTQVLGDRDHVGSVLKLAQLDGNETTLANLIRNFRHLEQIGDANRLEVLESRLWLRQLQSKLSHLPWWQWWRKSGSILSGFGVGLLLWLSEDGTSTMLVLWVGMMVMTIFAVLFWWLDQTLQSSRSLTQTAIASRAMLGSATLLLGLAMVAIWHSALHPFRTFLGISLPTLPPLLSLLWQRRQPPSQRHEAVTANDVKTDASATYFVENGGLRQLQLLLVRLPILPNFPMFRDRYMPIRCDRRWSWLNYYDFSLNNLFKVGFNDLRLRDFDVPGWVSFLVWYEWVLGVGYVALLLWTLARTIPGLNVLIYLR